MHNFQFTMHITANDAHYCYNEQKYFQTKFITVVIFMFVKILQFCQLLITETLCLFLRRKDIRTNYINVNLIFRVASVSLMDVVSVCYSYGNINNSKKINSMFCLI